MPVDLRRLLVGRQEQLATDLRVTRELLEHPGAKGDASEFDWRSAIESFLPNRYRVSKAFIVDSEGEVSDQIDLVIHDRHYCPLFFEQAGQMFIPAESVYAVFDIQARTRSG